MDKANNCWEIMGNWLLATSHYYERWIRDLKGTKQGLVEISLPKKIQMKPFNCLEYLQMIISIKKEYVHCEEDPLDKDKL